MMVDQTWTVRDVTHKMVSKDGVEIEPNWCILEKIPDLDMGIVTRFLRTFYHNSTEFIISNIALLYINMSNVSLAMFLSLRHIIYVNITLNNFHNQRCYGESNL